jgi:stage V sporulation protein AC
MELNKKEYDSYVKNVTPVHPLWPGMIRAFITGGTICALAQSSTMIMMRYWGMDQETSATWTQLELILCSILLTGFNIYPKIVQWGGAGALVPITGFANSVVAPAIEYKAEGHVFGIGCKIFTIAGPVILFGVFTSWVLGVICWMLQMIGIVQA